MAALRFLSWEEPFLPAVASAIDDEFGRSRVLDLRELLIAVPGNRSGRRLLELLVERASLTRRRLIPPDRILTVGSLPEELYEPTLPLASGALARRSWAQALEQAPGEILETALGPFAADSDMETRTRLARSLDSLNRSVGASCMTFQSVAEECRRGFLFSDEARWRALAHLQRDMRAILATVKLADREEARHRALLEGRVWTRKRLVLVGVAEAPLITRRMVADLSDDLLAFVHAPASEAESFDSLGLVAVDAWQGRAIPVPEEDLAVGDGPGDQAEEVVRFLGGLGGRYSAEDITIGTPDRSLVPFLARHLEERGVRTRYPEGMPLALSPPARLLQAVADYLGGRHFGALATLLRHPDLPASLGPGAAPECTDAFFASRFPDLIDRGEGSGGGRDHGLRRLLGTLHSPRLLGDLEGRARISEWMPRILSLLLTVYDDPGREIDPQHQRHVTEACLQIRKAADELHRLPAPLDEACAAHQAVRILLGELRDGRIPPEPGEGAVEMVGWLELQLDDAAVVVLTGVADPFLPESVNADTFLPNALRSRLGLEDNRSRYARDAYRLTALVRSTRDRLVIAPKRNAEGDPLRPSRLLLTGGDEEMARRLLRLTGDGERKPHPATPAIPRPGSAGFSLPPQRFIPIAEIPRPLPVTAFRALLEDPYVWALHYALGITDVDYDLQELDPMAFGTLAHRVLEGFARTPEAASQDAQRVRRRLHEILDRVCGETFSSNPLPTVPLQVEQLRTRLDAFADWQAGRVREGWEILEVEARTAPEGVAFDVDGEPVFLSGRVDRIDRHRETGTWILFDYKTGDRGTDVSSARKRNGEWKDLQLPLYHALVGHLWSKGGHLLPPPPPGVPVELGYIPLTRSQGPVEEALATWTPQDLASAEETAREVIRRLRREGGVTFQGLGSSRGAGGGMAALLGYGMLVVPEAEE